MATPPHQARLPTPTGLFAKLATEDRAFMFELVGALQRELDQCARLNSAIAERLMLAPNGAVYGLSVANDGTLVTTLRFGP